MSTTEEKPEGSKWRGKGEEGENGGKQADLGGGGRGGGGGGIVTQWHSEKLRNQNYIGNRFLKKKS